MYNDDNRMTKFLEKAFIKASELPFAEQDLLAQSLLDDLSAEELWEDFCQFAR